MSSPSPRDSIVLYLDRNIGSKIAPEILRRQGIHCEVHDDHLAMDAPDEEWIQLCATNGWIGITKDKNLRRNLPVLQVIKGSSVAIFVITAKNITGEQQAELLVDSYDKISNYCEKKKRPFIVSLTASGEILPLKF